MTKRTRRTRRPFCNPELMEAYKAMKRRELIRQGKSIPLTLLPTQPAEINMAEPKRSPFHVSNAHRDQRERGTNQPNR